MSITNKSGEFYIYANADGNPDIQLDSIYESIRKQGGSFQTGFFEYEGVLVIGVVADSKQDFLEYLNIHNTDYLELKKSGILSERCDQNLDDWSKSRVTNVFEADNYSKSYQHFNTLFKYWEKHDTHNALFNEGKMIRIPKDPMNKLCRREKDVIIEIEKLNEFNFSKVFGRDGMGFFVEGATIREITIKRSKIKKIPNNIDDLLLLKVIMLNGNEIEEIPESVGNLACLESLSLKDNKLKRLPKSITKIHSLKNLDLSNNQIKSLPENFGDLESIESLDLSNNNLSLIPKSCQNMTRLHYLNLENNPLNLRQKTIRKWIKTYKKNAWKGSFKYNL